jgi:hypothetical protein
MNLSQYGRVVPFGYTIGRSPLTGMWIVRRGERSLTNDQPNDDAAAAFARAHAVANPELPIVEHDLDPGPSNWTACPIRRALRQHRHEAEQRTSR